MQNMSRIIDVVAFPKPVVTLASTLGDTDVTESWVMLAPCVYVETRANGIFVVVDENAINRMEKEKLTRPRFLINPDDDQDTRSGEFDLFNLESFTIEWAVWKPLVPNKRVTWSVKKYDRRVYKKVQPLLKSS